MVIIKILIFSFLEIGDKIRKRIKNPIKKYGKYSAKKIIIASRLIDFPAKLLKKKNKFVSKFII
jgi:hypothetical protein